MEIIQKIILNDYTLKIKNKIPKNSNLLCSDINEFIGFFNYCFQQKNNFFVENFNKKVIKNIYVSYNRVKTNILTPEVENVFGDIELSNMKLLRFVLINFVNNFEIINPDNKELCENVSKDSLKRIIHYLNSQLK